MVDKSQERRRLEWFDGMVLAVSAALYFTGVVPLAAAVAVLVAVVLAKARVLPWAVDVLLLSGTIFAVGLGALDVLTEERVFDAEDAFWRGLLFGATMVGVVAIARFRRRSTGQ